MTETTTAAGAARPMLIGGERLRSSGDRPRGGGGDKWHPFTVEQAAARLLPEVAELRVAAAELPDRLRGSRVVVEATLMPNYLAASYFPGDLLDYIDGHAVGTRYASAPRRTSARPEGDTDITTKSLFIAADDHALGRLESVLASPSSPRLPKAVREDVQVIERLVLPGPADRLATPPSWGDVATQPQDELPVLESVLHPAGRNGSRLAPADTVTVARWVELVASLGGRVELDWMRVAGGLTFIPIPPRRDCAPRGRPVQRAALVAPDADAARAG